MKSNIKMFSRKLKIKISAPIFNFLSNSKFLILLFERLERIVHVDKIRIFVLIFVPTANEAES